MLFAIHAAATLAMTGLIWFVQLVHYPLFSLASERRFGDFAHEHQRRTSWIVAPLMLVEAGTAAILVSTVQPPETRALAWLGAGLLLLIWLSTALVQVPLHRRLLEHRDRAAMRRLVATNWARTALWTARSWIALALVVEGRGQRVSAFHRRLAALESSAQPNARRWLYVPYDQLNDGIGPLAAEPPAELGIVLVESASKAARRPYHRQKLALVLANQRHFALEQAARGVAVEYLSSEAGYARVLGEIIERRGPLRVMEPAERELRRELQPLIETGGLEAIPHDGWLTSPQQFAATPGPPWKMDSFYRRVRRDSGVLMEAGKPAGGKFSFDAENREPWSGEPEAPTPPRFSPDEVTQEVGDLIEERFARHPGRLRLSSLPATRADAERLWRWALEECLPQFGPFEDAMSGESRSLFHTRISGLLNLHRLLPARVVSDVAGMDGPIASREGFVRQILGWREFMRHVHRETDGFRRLPGEEGWSSVRSAHAGSRRGPG